MALVKAELIIHPVRLRIIQTLGMDRLTAAEISAALPDTPRSSMYRHLRLLLEGGMIQVVETRLVNGIQEKVYAMAQSAFLHEQDVAGLSAAQHQQMFAVWMASTLQAFSDYLSRSELEHGRPELGVDQAGYTEVVYFANDAEMAAFSRALNDALRPLIDGREANEIDSPRRKRKLATITYPLESPGR
jgi:hypothetical protein